MRHKGNESCFSGRIYATPGQDELIKDMYLELINGFRTLLCLFCVDFLLLNFALHLLLHRHWLLGKTPWSILVNYSHELSERYNETATAKHRNTNPCECSTVSGLCWTYMDIITQGTCALCGHALFTFNEYSYSYSYSCINVFQEIHLLSWF